MICKLCGKDTAGPRYDRVLDRFEVYCQNCDSHTVYTQLRSKEDVITAYEGPKVEKKEEAPEEPKKEEKKKAKR